MFHSHPSAQAHIKLTLPALPAGAERSPGSRHWKVQIMKSEISFVRNNGCAWYCKIEPIRGYAAITAGSSAICKYPYFISRTFNFLLQKSSSTSLVTIPCSLVETHCSYCLYYPFYIHSSTMRPIIAVLSSQLLVLSHLPSIFANPLQHNLPTLLTPEPRNSTMLPLFNITALDESPCFLPSAERLPVNYADCEPAIAEMYKGSDMRVYTFGRGPRSSGVTYRLPKTFHVRTCVLTLDMVHEDQMDRLSFFQVREAALNLAIQCTNGVYFNVGGIQAVEPRNVLYITIFGAAPPRSIS